jgi:hypothetical protein
MRAMRAFRSIAGSETARRDSPAAVLAEACEMIA